MSDQIHHGAHRSSDPRLGKDTLKEMTRRWNIHLERARQMGVLAKLKERTADERELQKQLRESQLRSSGVEKALLSRIREQQEHRAKQIAYELARLTTPYQAPRPLPGRPRITDNPNGANELWWGQTNWSWDDPGITPFWDDNAGLRFSGEIDLNVDEFTRRNLTIVAQFFLTADRVSPSVLRMANSAPSANVFGTVRGAVLAGLLDFGDQWCKCWLDLSQTVMLESPDAPGVWIPSFSTSSSINLIDLDTTGDGFASNFFPGPVQLPAVPVLLIPGWNIQIDLQFLFDIQLEGDHTLFTFGNSPEFQTNLVQTFEWQLPS